VEAPLFSFIGGSMKFIGAAAIVKSIKEFQTAGAHFPVNRAVHFAHAIEDAKGLGLIFNPNTLTRYGALFYEKASLYYLPSLEYYEWDVSDAVFGRIYHEMIRG
jgi:hypothetical protein